MPNSFYNHGSVPANRAPGSSAAIRAEFDAVTAGFNLLPTLSGNAYKLIAVNSAGSALEPIFTGYRGAGNIATNTAYGTGTLAVNTTGANSTAIGFNALPAAIIAVGNTAVGSNAGLLATGGSNSLFGYNAAPTLTTGTQNTVLGSTADVAAGSTNSTAVGFGATSTASNEVVLGNASVTLVRAMADNVTDLGAAAKRYKVVYSASFIGSTLTSNVATGTAPLVVASTTQVTNLYASRAAIADAFTGAPTAWQIKTTAYSAVVGDAIMANTTSAAFAILLPASPAASDVVRIADYAGTWATNNLTLTRNGNRIQGLLEDLVCNVNNFSGTLAYIDATQGWRLT